MASLRLSTSRIPLKLVKIYKIRGPYVVFEVKDLRNSWVQKDGQILHTPIDFAFSPHFSTKQVRSSRPNKPNNLSISNPTPKLTAPTSCHLNVVVQSPPQWGWVKMAEQISGGARPKGRPHCLRLFFCWAAR